MFRIIATRVHVSVIFGHQINVMKTVAVVIILVKCVDKRCIHDYCLVKCAVAVLFCDVDFVIELLALEERVKVGQEGYQVGLPVSVWNDHS